jgi:hypothetical protein
MLRAVRGPCTGFPATDYISQYFCLELPVATVGVDGGTEYVKMNEY